MLENRMFSKAFLAPMYFALLSFSVALTPSIKCSAQLDTMYYYSANRAMDNNDIDLAISIFTKAISYCSPNSGELRNSYVFRALCKTMNNDCSGAIDDLKSAFAINEVKTSKIYWIIDKDEIVAAENIIAYNIWGACCVAKNDFNSACYYYTKACELGDEEGCESAKKYCSEEYNNKSIVWRNRSLEFFSENNFNEALAAINESLTINSHDDIALLIKAMILSKMEKEEEAIKAATESISYNPSNFITYVIRGFSYHFKEKYSNAISDYSAAIKLCPDNADIYMFRGIANADAGYYYAAQTDFNKVIEIEPGNAKAYYYKGLVQISVSDGGACESMIKSYQLGYADAYSYVLKCTTGKVQPIEVPSDMPCIRVGAICWDGWYSNATGQGACSHHGGVYQWLCK
jgi:tetratricopeptide (TPR) repeat protein